jgi:hypothetical protein
MKLKRKWLAIALGVGEIGALASAHAQDIRVNVTGSNIRRVDTETAAPIQTITREDIPVAEGRAMDVDAAIAEAVAWIEGLPE